jgi:hypothetical protein
LHPSKQSGTEYNVRSHVLPKSVEAQTTKEMAGLSFVLSHYSYPQSTNMPMFTAMHSSYNKEIVGEHHLTLSSWLLLIVKQHTS